MTKEQFLLELEEYLRGEVSDYELRDSLEYYRNYYEEQITDGSSEEDVSSLLGSPRLIARSIIDARGNGEDHDKSGWQASGTDYDRDSEGGEYPREQEPGQIEIIAKRALIMIVIGLIVAGLVIFTVAALPYIALVIVIYTLLRLFRE